MCISKTINDNPIVKFTEKINCSKALKVAKLSNSELKDLFWDKDEINKADNEKWSWTTYLTSIRRFLKLIVSKNGKIENTYKYGKSNYDGRLYVNGFGVQSLQNKIRNYICNDYYNELDISNCHPSLLVYLCEENNIYCDTFKNYVLNRKNLLEKHNLDKFDILKALNTDINKKKKNNDFYNLLIGELESIKKSLKEKIELPKTDNKKNPLSSSVNKLLLRHEGLIIQEIIKKIGVKNIGFPLFDAVYFDKNISVDINEINELEFIKKYKYIKFDIKDTIEALKDFELPEDFDETKKDYKYVKEEFEKNHFQTLSPPCFWKQILNSDGTKKYIQYSTKDFQLACKEFEIEEINDSGKVIYKSIFDNWIKDKTRRKYETIDFMPYGKTDKSPNYVFNTFEGFEINKEKNIDSDSDDDIENYINCLKSEEEDINIDNFMEYMSNLVGEQELYNNNMDCPKTEYFTKYIAHMFQYPEKQTRKIICLKGWTGTGKDTLLKLIRAIMGSKYCDLTSDAYDLFKDFNDILDSKVAIFLNEMEGKDGIKIQEKLKDLATRDYNKVNSKHEKKIQQRNFIRLFVLSNNDSPVNIQIHDRRYVVFNSGYGLVVNQADEKKSNYALKFWTKFNDDLKNKKWLEKVYNQLMEIDLSNYCPDKSAPQTEEYKLMKEKNNIPLYPFICELYENQKLDDFYTDKKTNKYYISFKDFKNKYLEFLDNNNLTPDYKIKDTWIKQKLSTCNNTFNPSVRKQFIIDGVKIRKEFAEFDFKNMIEFINDFLIQKDNNDNDEIINIEKCDSCNITDSDLDN